MYGTANLDILVSNTGISSGTFDLCLDIGNDGTCDYTHAGTTAFPATLSATSLQTALNNYLLSRTDIPWGSPVDVPVRVQSSRQADVMLTNLALSPSGAKVRFVRLAALNYGDIRLSLQFLQSGVSSGPLSFTVDVGADGSPDWSYAGSPSFPAVVQSANLAAAFNAYLAGRSGVVDIPLRITPSPYLDTALYAITATPASRADLTLAPADISFGASAPSEGALVTVNANVHNTGGLDSGPLVAAFFATPPGASEVYIGSSFVENVPAGETVSTPFDWNTLGFTGTVPVRVALDPYNRVLETSDANNQATAGLGILTRADLTASAISMNIAEPVANQAVTVSVTYQNSGQTAASASVIALYDGDPSSGGTLIGQSSLPLAAGDSQVVQFNWTPTTLGEHRLFAVSDQGAAINESNEGNNLAWQDVYIGLPAPVLLDSGSAGDLAYSPGRGYGYLDEGQADALSSCSSGSPVVDSIRRDPLGTVVYQFNYLQPAHYYHLDLTLFECDGAGRQQSIYIDGNLIAGPIDLGDHQVHRLSLLLDPALYRDHLVRVEVRAPGIDGAVVSEVNLYDIDYRYADAGGSADPQFPGAQNYGWLDGTASNNWGRLPYQSVRVDQNDNTLSYRFDSLNSTRSYKLNLVFWQPSGTGHILNTEIDGVFTGLTVDTSDYQLHRQAIDVPASAYAADGSIVVTILRTDASAGAMINEISLEELTISSGSLCSDLNTPYFSQSYGNVTVNGVSALPGTVVQALSPRGTTVGCFTVGVGGEYGLMRLFGEDTSVSPAIPGLRDGEMVIFKINGATAVSTPLLYWHNDLTSHNINLAGGLVAGQSILLRPNWNLVSTNVEPPYPLIPLVLSSLTGKYILVLGETGVYNPALSQQYQTLAELHSRAGYYIRSTHPTSMNLLVEGVPQAANTSIALHAGWNWIGYMPGFNLPVAQALQSIQGQFQIIHSLDRTYDVSIPPQYNTLQEMKPGEGYIIYMNQAATLVYPSSPAMLGTNEQPPEASPTACDQVNPTPTFTVVYGEVQINGLPAPVGSRVEMVTPRGEVAGCFIFEKPGVMGLTHIYGADSLDTAGFLPGEEIKFKINGIKVQPGSPLVWANDMLSHQVNLNITANIIFLPYISR